MVVVSTAIKGEKKVFFFIICDINLLLIRIKGEKGLYMTCSFILVILYKGQLKEKERL